MTESELTAERINALLAQFPEDLQPDHVIIPRETWIEMNVLIMPLGRGPVRWMRRHLMRWALKRWFAWEDRNA